MKLIEDDNILNNFSKKNSKKEISISIFTTVLLLIMSILLIVLSFNVYATNESNNNEYENVVENLVEQESETEDILIVEKDSKQENNDIIEIEDIEEQQEEKEETTQKINTNEIIYTAKNGEKYSIVGKLDIPNLNIKYDILSTSSTALLEISLNRYWGAYPNQVGNMVVIGHNYKNSKFFGNLLKIERGDIVKITDNNGKTLDYSVYDTYIIDPDDNSCTSQLTNGNIEITLITCYYENENAHATKRFVVKARAN